MKSVIELARNSPVFAAFRTDPMLRNSGYLSLTTVTMSFLGFLAWMLNTRLFSAETIGKATALISATSLISYVSLLGFNSSLIRFLPGESDRKAYINTALTLCAATALVVGSCYVLALPLLAPKLDFMRQDPFYALSFVILTACAAVNLLTDSIFIAFREAGYNFLVDGIIQGITKLGLPLLLVGFGAFGIFASSGVAAGMAVVASLYFIRKIFGHHFRPVVNIGKVSHTLRFSAATYISSLFNLFPVLAVPLIVLDRDGPAAAGYYFVAFQLATLLYSLSYAISESVLAEGSRSETDLRRLARRSFFLVEDLAAAGVIIFTIGGHFVLLLFGEGYSTHAAIVLAGLAVGAPANALNAWASNLLKVTGQFYAMIVSNVVYTVVIVGMVWFFARQGLGSVALAWFFGTLASGLVAAAALRFGWKKHVTTVTSSHRAAKKSLPRQRIHSRIASEPVVRPVPLLARHRGLHTKKAFNES